MPSLSTHESFLIFSFSILFMSECSTIHFSTKIFELHTFTMTGTLPHIFLYGCMKKQCESTVTSWKMELQWKIFYPMCTDAYMDTHSLYMVCCFTIHSHLGGFKKQHLGVHFVKEVGGKVHLRALIGLPVSVFVAPEHSIPIVCSTVTNYFKTSKIYNYVLKSVLAGGSLISKETCLHENCSLKH